MDYPELNVSLSRASRVNCGAAIVMERLILKIIMLYVTLRYVIIIMLCWGGNSDEITKYYMSVAT